MSTDSEGRPLSDDGQWAWNGTEWVPAAGGGAAPPASGDSGDAGATMIAQSPFAGGGAPGGQPGFGAPSAPPADTPGYGGGQGYGSTPGAAPGYGSTPGAAPGYGGAPGYGTPTPQKSRTPLIVAVVSGVVIIIAVVLILIFTLGGSHSLAGKYTCTAKNQSGSAAITFNSGNTYALSDQGQGGTFTKSGSTVKFNGGSLNGLSAKFDSDKNNLTFSFQGIALTCKH
jgi:hypothetical protein